VPVALIAWIAALAFAAVVLAFCSYEVHWKARRLRADLERLRQLGDELRRVQDSVAGAQAQLARLGASD
jgi:hypothetical protein